MRGWKLRTRLEAVIFKTLCAKNYEGLFKLLQVIEEKLADIFS